MRRKVEQGGDALVGRARATEVPHRRVECLFGGRASEGEVAQQLDGGPTPNGGVLLPIDGDHERGEAFRHRCSFHSRRHLM